MLVLTFVLTALVYVIGVMRIRNRARSDGVVAAPVLAMLGGILVLGVALASPLDELAEQMLSAHMVQHLLLMLIAAPLLVCARPMPALIWVLPRAVRGVVGRASITLLRSPAGKLLERPATAWLLFCGSLGLWHLPAIYRWALESEWRHALMHLTFLGSALLFWSIVLEPGRVRRLDRGRTILFVLSTALVTGLPGALLSLAQHVIYYEGTPAPLPFGLTPLQDQQLAGLLMWIPMDGVLFGVAAVLFHAWLVNADQTPGSKDPAQNRA